MRGGHAETRWLRISTAAPVPPDDRECSRPRTANEERLIANVDYFRGSIESIAGWRLRAARLKVAQGRKLSSRYCFLSSKAQKIRCNVKGVLSCCEEREKSPRRRCLHRPQLMNSSAERDNEAVGGEVKVPLQVATQP